MSGKTCYDLDGLRDVMRLAQRAIKQEKSTSVRKIVFYGSTLQVITAEGWSNSTKLNDIEDWKALNYIKEYHPDGLAIDAHKAMNCII